MQARRSMDHARRVSSGSLGGLVGGGGHREDREGLIQSYDEENGGFGLHDLTEDSEEEGEGRAMNGRAKSAERENKEGCR